MAHNFLPPAFPSQQFWQSAIDHLKLLESTGVCGTTKSNRVMVQSSPQHPKTYPRNENADEHRGVREEHLEEELLFIQSPFSTWYEEVSQREQGNMTATNDGSQTQPPHNLHTRAPTHDPDSLPTPMDGTHIPDKFLQVDHKPPAWLVHHQVPGPYVHPSSSQKLVQFARGRRGSGDAVAPRVLEHQPLALKTSISTSAAEHSLVFAATSKTRKPVSKVERSFFYVTFSNCLGFRRRIVLT